MSQKPLTLSIVIPAYNEERYLPKCLDAIAAQSHKPDEVIVIDNISTDRTVEIARSYPFVTILNEPQQGITFARNRGFDAAHGDIIGRIDADTVLPPSWVAQVKRFFDEPGRERSVLTGGCRFYNLHTGWLTAYGYGLVVNRLNRLLLGYYFPWGSNSALPREAWESVRQEITNRADIHEDLDLGIHLGRHGYRIVYRPRLRVGARAKRVRTERGDLWRWLAMWPRTFRCDGLITWPLVWLLAILVWLGCYGVLVTELIADMFSYSPPKTK